MFGFKKMHTRHQAGGDGARLAGAAAGASFICRAAGGRLQGEQPAEQCLHVAVFARLAVLLGICTDHISQLISETVLQTSF